MSARDALAAIRERAEGATRAPWLEVATLHPDGRYSYGVTGEAEDDVCEMPYTPQGSEDARFVTAARTDVPALVEGHEAVLEIHKPEWTSDHHGGGYYRCSADHWTLDDQTPACPTVHAIETALETR